MNRRGPKVCTLEEPQRWSITSQNFLDRLIPQAQLGRQTCTLLQWEFFHSRVWSPIMGTRLLQYLRNLCIYFSLKYMNQMIHRFQLFCHCCYYNWRSVCANISLDLRSERKNQTKTIRLPFEGETYRFLLCCEWIIGVLQSR
jgi:hypothetical protein